MRRSLVGSYSRLSIVLVITAIFFLPASSPLFAQGPTGVINPLDYSGTDLCAKIQTAIAENSSANPQGLVIDARSATGTQNCSVNPFSGATVPGQLLLGATVLETTMPIVTPSLNAWQILGSGRGNNGNGTGTLIQAVTGFPSSGILVRLGDGTHITFGNRIENLALDCNGMMGAIGLYSTDIQEQSGGSDLVITNCPARELWINGSGSDGTGPQFAMNYSFHDVEAYALNVGTSTTIACEFDGDNTSQPGGPHLLTGLTCSGSPSHPIAAGFVFDSFSGSTITNLGAEGAATGYIIGNLAPMNSVTFNSLGGGSITGSVVHVKNPPPLPDGNVTTDIELTNIVDHSGTAAALITDDVLGETINTQRTIGTYRIGDVQTSFGSFVPGYTHFTDSPFFNSALPGLTLNNSSDSATGNLLKISSGVTTTAPALVELDDRGMARWQIGKDGSENFELVDNIANVMRIQAVPNSSMEINAAGSGTLFLNLFAGTGGVEFCSGVSSCPALISSAGGGSFASVAIPSLGASTSPLCTTAGGVITNVGCTAPPRFPGVAGSTPGVGSEQITSKQAALSPAGLSVQQVSGAAPLDSPAFTGTPSLPSVAGNGSALFRLGMPKVVGGVNASIICAVGHLCDSFSGTLALTTGSDSISAFGHEVITISLPVVRQNLPNCLVNVAARGSEKSLSPSIRYDDSSSIAIDLSSPLASSTTYVITYLCGGN